MPDIIRLRWLGGDDATIPVLGRMVAADEIVDLAGRVLDVDEHDQPAPDDAYLIEFGNPPERRLFPKSQWRLEAPTAKKPKE